MEFAFHLELKWKMGAEEAGRENRAGGKVQPRMRRGPGVGGFPKTWGDGPHQEKFCSAGCGGRRIRLWGEAAIRGSPAPLPGRLCTAASRGLRAAELCEASLGRGGAWHSIRSLGCPADLQYLRFIHPGGGIIPKPRASEKDQTPKLSEVPPRRQWFSRARLRSLPLTLSHQKEPQPGQSLRSDPGLAEMWLLSIGMEKMD